MTLHVVGVGDLVVSNTKGDTLKTFALGSCVSVVLYDPVCCVGGMLHLVLPHSTPYLSRQQRSSAYFADTGVAALVTGVGEFAGHTAGRWICKLAGGANVLNPTGPACMDIGGRNIAAARQELARYGISPVAEDVGLNHSRTVSFEVGDPRLFIQNRAIGDISI